MSAPDPAVDPAATLAWLVDDRAVARVMVDYARGIDRRDFDLVRSLYLPDAFIKGTSFEGSRDEYLDILFPGVRRYPVTQHFLGNQTRDLEGERAWTETYLIAHHFADPEGKVESLIMGVRYQDQLERQELGRWAIRRRDVFCDWQRVGEPVA